MRTRLGPFLPALLLPAIATADAPAPQRETAAFSLYKWQRPIGVERSIVEQRPDGAVEIRTNFSFTDRSATVPLAATLELAPGGAPARFQIWGLSSRVTSVDDEVVVSGKQIEIDRDGVLTSVVAPAAFFVGSAYAPVVMTEQLWRYWSSHGRPKSLPVFPAGTVSIQSRGSDGVEDDDGKKRTLERYSLDGLEWGRETLWVDEEGRLAALKSVDAEFDHFEATRRGFSLALAKLVASAAADGMVALRETSEPLLAAPDDGRPVAYVRANLVTGTGAPAVPDAVVVVQRGSIVAAGPRAEVRIPSGARRVDVAGKTILPGLWDMHAHFEQVEWGPIYLAAGVTTVRDCGNELDFIRSVRDTIDTGKGLGPRILLACLVDGDGPASLGTSVLHDIGEIPKLIRGFNEAGCAQVKIYSSLDPKLIAPLAQAAHAAGMTVTGHVPNRIGAVHAVEAGLDQINHIQFISRALFPPEVDPDDPLDRARIMRGLLSVDPSSPSSQKTIAFLASHHVVVDPTFALEELGTHTPAENAAHEPGLAKVAPELRAPLGSFGVQPGDAENAHRRWEVSRAVLRALHRAGVTIVAGTDQSVPGHSLHRELELYVEAGFTPMEAIQAATIVPARAMKRDRDLGTVEAGKRADLIVVDGNPLEDIRALRRIVTVIAAGRAYDTAKLWKSVGFGG